MKKSLRKFKDHMSGWLKLTVEPLQRQRALWFWTGLVLIPTLVIALRLFWGRQWNWSNAGATHFLEILSPLLPLFAFAIAVAALIARMHSTVQTHRQIEVAGANNTLKNFLDHRKYFRESYALIDTSGFSREGLDDLAIYNAIFPDNGPTAFSANPSLSRDQTTLVRAVKAVEEGFNNSLDVSLDETQNNPAFQPQFFAAGIISAFETLKFELNEEKAEFLHAMASSDQNFTTGHLDRLRSILDFFIRFTGKVASIANDTSSGITIRCVVPFRQIIARGGRVPEALNRRDSDI